MKLIKYILFVLFAYSIAFAAPSPEKKVDEIFNRIKKEKSYGVMAEYVHWETEFKRMPAEQKAAMGINSPEELKSKMKGLMTDPKAAMKKEMNTRMNLSSLPPEQQKMIAAMMEKQLDGMTSKMDKSLNDLESTSYKILDTKVDGNIAKIDMEVTSPTETKKEKVELEMIEGDWYVSLKDMNKNSPAMQR